MLKRTLMLLVLAVAAIFAVACEDSPEEGAAIFAVSNINGGNPVTVTTVDGTGGNVSMTFRWRPYNDVDGTITEAAPHGDYIIEHYRITWTAASTGATALSPREEETSIFVPVYDLVPADIRVVTPTEAASVSAGTALVAHLEFTARELGTERDAKFATSFTVAFE